MTTAANAGLVAHVLPAWPLAVPRKDPFLIGVLPGEGIGPEVIGASLRALDTVAACTGHRFELRWGGKIGLDAQRESGKTLTPQVMGFCEDIFAGRGAVLCGPGGGRFVYELRSQFDLFCKLAPLKPLPALRNVGVIRPEALRDVDILVIRENAGGLYLGESGHETAGGRSRAWHRFHYDEREVLRILRVALAASKLRRGRLCVVTKPAGVPRISELWQSTAISLAAGSGVNLRLLEVDTASYQLVAAAREFDVVVAPNMFGDILADGAGVLLGSRGVSYSANFSDRGCAVYQTGHGAAYDLAGRDEANPVGQIQSLAMMLRESFDLPEISAQLIGAVDDTLAEGWRTPDIMAPGGRQVGTGELGERIATALEARLAPIPLRSAAGLSE